METKPLLVMLLLGIVSLILPDTYFGQHWSYEICLSFFIIIAFCLCANHWIGLALKEANPRCLSDYQFQYKNYTKQLPDIGSSIYWFSYKRY